MDFCFGPSYEEALPGAPPPPGCNSSFELKTTSYTDPLAAGFVPHHTGEVILNAFHPTSTYEIDWGDGSLPSSTFTHSYPFGPGSYTVCVTEIIGGIPACKTCMTFCFGSSYSEMLIGTNGNMVAPPGNGGNKNAGELDEYGINIYPNPATHRADVSFTLARQQNVKITLMDINGRILTEVLDKAMEAGNHNAEINTEKIAAGFYNVQVRIGDETSMKKLLIIK
jgi:hypothetical protein